MGLIAGEQMPTLYVANFDFDDRLAKPAMTTLPAKLHAINARLAPLLKPLCEPGDAVAVPGDRLPDAGRFDRVEPWGVEPHVLRWLGLIGVRDDVLRALPNPAAVRTVNGRRWQWETERALNVLPTGATREDRTTLICDAAERLAGGWALKREHGGSGRGVLLGLGRPSGRQTAWLAAVPAGQAVTIEPRDLVDAEISAHFTVTADSATFDGLCSLRSSLTGQFQSVEPLADPPAPLLAPLPVWTAVAERARAEDYRGPLGIDAAVRDGVVVRPVRDVNARWTMGRVALRTGRRVSNP